MSSDRPAALEAMVRRFRPYPEYKDSGVEWLGKIPAHWEVRRLKTFADVQLSNVDKKSVEGEEPVRLCNYVDVYYNERITADLDFMLATATPDQIRQFSLRRGDVLITKDSESWTDIAVPAVVAEDLPGVVAGYHLAHIRPHSGCDGEFLAYELTAIGPRDQFQISANGITRFGLASDAIRGAILAFPPLDEQRAIRTFLAHETARVERLISQKERLIALLNERLAAIIRHHTARGIDASATLEESGFDWLGAVPSHWKITRLKHVASLQRGFDLPGHLRTEGDYPVVSSAGVIGTHAQAAVPGPGVVTGRYGSVGAVFFIEEDYWPLNTALYVRDFHGNVPRFIFWLLHALSEMIIEREGAKSAVPGVDRNDLHEIMVPLPPSQEQAAIAGALDREASHTGRLIARIRSAIEQLKEFRTALISAAVTGQIDVREEVA